MKPFAMDERTKIEGMNPTLSDIDFVSYFENIHGESYAFLCDTRKGRCELWGSEVKLDRPQDFIEFPLGMDPIRIENISGRPYSIVGFMFSEEEALMFQAIQHMARKKSAFMRGTK